MRNGPAITKAYRLPQPTQRFTCRLWRCDPSSSKNLRNERLTIDEIADRLISDGVKTRSGGVWRFTEIRRVLARA